MRALFAILLIVAVAACGETKPPSQSPTGQPAATSVTLASPTPAASTSPPSASPTATAAAAAAPTAKPTSSPTATPIALPPTGALAANPKTKVKVAGATKVRYFKVAGSTPDELLASVVASSKAMCHSSDTLACVLDSPVVHWTKRTNLSTGRCRISAEYVTLKSVVSLPVWTKPSKVPPGLVTWWQAMLKHFAWHEGQHIKIEKKYDAKLKSLLVGQPCSAAKKILKKWATKRDAAQDKFDASDRSWSYPAYTGS